MRDSRKILIVIILILACVLWFYSLIDLMFSYRQSQIQNNDCFKEIARGECKERGLSFGKVDWSFGYFFTCKEDVRKSDREYFDFLKHEVKKCLKGGKD